MKVVLLAQAHLNDKTVNINGTLVQLFNLSKGFHQHGVEVHYIATTKDKTKPTSEIIDGIHFHWVQSKTGILEWKRIMREYDTLLNNIQPDALYVRGRNVLQYVAGKYAQQNKKVYVWGTNGEDSAEFWENIKRLKHKDKSLVRKLLLMPLKAFEDLYINRGMKMAKFIINQSTEQQRTTKENLGVNGVLLPSYFYLPETKERTKDDMIIWLANVSQAKQPKLFIDLIDSVQLNNWSAILAGGSGNIAFENTIKQSTENTKVEMIGKVPFKESFELYQRAKIYINTSKPDADGLPNAYIQSWLSGTVILSLHHDPNNWMEQHNIGYCSHGDLNKLKEKLQELIEKPNELIQMGENAKCFAKKQFSNDDIILSYIDIFTNNRTGLQPIKNES